MNNVGQVARRGVTRRQERTRRIVREKVAEQSIDSRAATVDIGSHVFLRRFQGNVVGREEEGC